MGRRGTKLALVLAVAAALLSVPVAQATPPTIVPAPGVDFTDTTSCGFDVDVHLTANGQTAKIFSDGTIIVTGPLAATFSANGKSVALNVSGPATITGESVIGHGVGAGPYSAARRPDNARVQRGDSGRLGRGHHPRPHAARHLRRARILKRKLAGGAARLTIAVSIRGAHRVGCAPRRGDVGERPVTSAAARPSHAAA